MIEFNKKGNVVDSVQPSEKLFTKTSWCITIKLSDSEKKRNCQSFTPLKLGT